MKFETEHRVSTDCVIVIDKTEYEVDRRYAKQRICLRDGRLNEEWLEFVRKNRSEGGLQHDYDVVIGPVADDRTMETIQLYMADILSAEEAVERLRYNNVNKEDGAVTFTDLLVGGYLVVQSVESTGFYAINPFLVTVPLKEGESWSYDVDGTPKAQIEILVCRGNCAAKEETFRSVTRKKE